MTNNRLRRKNIKMCQVNTVCDPGLGKSDGGLTLIFVCVCVCVCVCVHVCVCVCGGDILVIQTENNVRTEKKGEEEGRES